MMKHLAYSLLAFSCLVFSVSAWDTKGEIGLELRGFTEDGTDPRQERGDFGLSVHIEFVKDLESGAGRLAFVPFARIQLHDENRSHGDIRELFYEHYLETWEFRLGIGQEYWGVTEFVHLVNVINQVDTLESLDEEKRLGQPMMKASYLGEFGQIDFFALLGLRTREFPGIEGRIRAPLLVNTDYDQFESGAKEKRLDWAMRFSKTIDNIDLGLTLFHGQQRDAQLRLNSSTMELYAYYDTITQVGFDGLIAIADWILKMEVMSRSIDGMTHAAFTGGFEYTLVGIFQSTTDLGLILETAIQNHRDRYSPMSSEIIVGSRFAFNDVMNSEILAGIIYDTHLESTVFSIEGSRRLSDQLKISIEGRVYHDMHQNDPLAFLDDEDHLTLQLSYFF